MIQKKCPRVRCLAWLVGLFCILCIVRSELEATLAKYDEAVSLGTNCPPAWHLHINDLRTVAYPFDWLITPLNGLISFSLHRGEGLFDADNLKIDEIMPGTPLT